MTHQQPKPDSMPAELRLWHDDIRPAPEGWTWARTNAQAQEIIATGNVVEISLDHDLGLDYFTEEQIDADPELLFGKGQSEQTGYDLVVWMIDNECVPPMVTIHSWNPAGAERMRWQLRNFGHHVLVSPYSPPGTVLL